MSSGKPSLDALRIDRSALPPRRSNGWIWLVLLLPAALGAGWFFLGGKGAPGVDVATASSVSGESAGPATILDASGYVTARRAATVSSKVTGKVVEIIVEEGMEVKEGQLLAKLDSSNVEASLRLAETQLESSRRSLEETRANIGLAEKELARFRTLVASQAGNQADLDRAEAQSRALSARLLKQTAEIAVAEAEVGQWKQQVADTVITAPFPGVVTSKNAQPGEMISPMSVGGFTRTGICTIVDMSSLEIEVDVNESYINKVRAGAPVVATLDSYQDLKLPAKVIAIIPTADRQKATVKVRVGFEKLDPRILPDMSVKVSFKDDDSPKPAASGTLVSVPKSAIHSDAGRSIVWVERDGRVERRAVSVAQTTGDTTLVSAGLSAGERVVSRSSAPLADGAAVKLQKR